MKKKIFFIGLILSLLILLPIKTIAKTYYSDYKTLNLKEALSAEEIGLVNKDYKETDKQAIIYLFRGQGCGYCKRFLTFLSSISKDYGKYFKLVSFEVWNDSDNSALMHKIAKVTGEEAGGVPYIVIGENVFPGYISDWDNDIKDAIKKQYNDNSYDVFTELEKAEKDPNFDWSDDTTTDETTDGSGETEEYSTTSNTSSSSSTSIIVWNLVFILVATFAIIVTIIIQNNKLLMQLKKGKK